MKKQTGFTLIELAIVLVIIGLLLGGVLRGQELINSARVKNLTRDFQNVQVYLYGYQDRFRAIPGDDGNAAARMPGPPVAISAVGANANNGLINGQWNSANVADESFLFWQHVRLAGLAPGSANTGNVATFEPRNANNGRIGIQSIGANFTKINDMQGAYAICSDLILGRDALQIDTTLDDGDTATGNIRVRPSGADGASSPLGDVTAAQAAQYTVCMSI
ncbi:MAG: prepilin-type cleavage/methylation domain-containing protein [Methylophilaceae bacterium 17-44-8]|jgi:prepilin-type N-terminal cleavage/methylation domain-containing protein|nr:MAG: prepilin-type cleavage/methylation domain-containing protein [Methylophilales bacterium 28-44-11]OZA06192.1 MAG: prepilin-type cleavage/methylation domain-containing protein [Methylophilaceae bacterium 17-44-8]